MTDIVKQARNYARNLAGPPEDYLVWQLADEIERLRREVQAERDVKERLRAAVAVLLDGIGGHHHWDTAGTSGANCPTCQRQTEAMIRAGELVSGAAPTTGERISVTARSARKGWTYD